MDPTLWRAWLPQDQAVTKRYAPSLKQAGPPRVSIQVRRATASESSEKPCRRRVHAHSHCFSEDSEAVPHLTLLCEVKPSHPHGSSQFQSRAGQARFERRPTLTNLRELMVSRRGEAPLVPPYILCNFKRDGAVESPHTWHTPNHSTHRAGPPSLSAIRVDSRGE